MVQVRRPSLKKPSSMAVCSKSTPSQTPTSPAKTRTIFNMRDYEKLGQFYLGRLKDSEQKLHYDAKDLMTHAVCVGMTGSGKTGLCVSLIEEAALDGIPALVIDPKGDLTNLLLAFPELRPEDFRPWVNPDEARLKGLEVDEFAAQQAALWQKGLGAWDQDGERIREMIRASEFTVYTPGSDAGVPVSVLDSFKAPAAEELDDREGFRDRISTTVSSLLGLAGIAADPVQSREHIFLSHVFDLKWRKGEDLDLVTLISLTQSWPFAKVGVLDLESFYPAKERFHLVMALNNLLASPDFAAWLEGEPFDIQSMLYTPQGKPRIAILSIAHLNDSERMFFVSLLLNQVLGWVRRQTGTSSLRAILYMDEIFGFFPPVANPPSKRPLLTLLKQARAFGLGVVLATQNPVDLDYKGLANTGTWFIGRLQTERDKQRVMEGLEGASAAGGGRFDKGRMEQILAGLGNRVFLMNNVHDDEPVIFQTRWAMSYLRGPMGKPEIRRLMAARKAAPGPASEAPVPAAAKTAPTGAASARPVLPPGIPQYFLPLGGSVLHYEPCIVGAAQIQFQDLKQGVDQVRQVAYAAPVKDAVVAVDWSAAEELDLPLDDLEKSPAEGATFSDLPGAAANPRSYAAWQKDFATWLYQTQAIELYRSPSTGEVSRPGESERDFRIRIQQTARELRDAQAEKLRLKYAPKLQTLNDRLFRAQQKIEVEKQQASTQKMQSMLTIGTSLLGAFLGRKAVSAANVGRIGTAARSASRIGKESSDVARAEESSGMIQQQIRDLETQFQADVNALPAAGAASETMETLAVKAKKTGINVQLTALAWR